MSLVKSLALTPAKIAANQANAVQSKGAVTPKGLERIRRSAFRHGLYMVSPREVLQALGADPEQFDGYQQALLDQWQPADAFQERLVRRIARTSFRLELAGRAQENTIVREVEKLALERDAKALPHARRVEEMLAALDALAEMNRSGEFADHDAIIAAYRPIYGPNPTERGKEVHELIYLLSPALQVARGRVTPEQATLPTPNQRARLSIRLTELLEAERAAVEAWDNEYRREHVDVSPAEFGALLGPAQVHAPSMIRQEESLARQLERDVRLLVFLREKGAKKSEEQADIIDPRKASVEPEKAA